MAYTSKTYLGGVSPATLVSDITTTTGVSTVSVNIPSTTGWADLAAAASSSAPTVFALDYGLSSEEKVLVDVVVVTGNTATLHIIQRAYDNSTGQTHSAATNGLIVPVAAAVDFREANAAVVNTIGKIANAGEILAGTAAGTMTNVAAGTGDAILVGGTSPSFLSAAGASFKVPVSAASSITWQPAVYGNPSARIYPTAQTSVTTSATFPGTGGGTQVGSMATEYVNGGMTVATNQITVPISGYYSISCLITWQSFNSGGAVTNLVKTASGVDSVVAQWMGYSNGSGQTPAIGGASTIFLGAGNKIALGCKQNNGSTQNTNFGTTLTWLAATLVSV